MKKLFQVVLVLLLSSCDAEFIKVIDVELGRGPEDLVVYSINGPDYNMYVDLYETKTVQTSAFHSPVLGASIFLFKDDLPLDTLTFSFGRYWSKYRAQPDANYRFEITSESKQIAYEITLPDLVPIAQFTAGSSQVTDNSGDDFNSIESNLIFDDPEGKHWYMIHYEIGASLTEPFYPVYLYSSDASVRREYGDADLFGENEVSIGLMSPIIISDELFNNDLKVLEAQLPTSGGSNTFYVRASIFSVSEKVYRFYKELMAQQGSIDNPFAEPIALDGYVPGAVGLVGGWQKSVTERRVTIVPF